ncbi:PTS lactose/cellobiose transporter subunit IIA [Abiotrophia defectiva]|jgi:hypothetical protein|uniref:PTS lactose/cellobiose transporter subunit IIA n=1 Tax=Abiotrophia defectiva TaxID=46125 RepID=UPI0028ED18DC|nr:PTS lactose/cellobiose transporter subunit IIA [Abiotrophia defectiva]
MTEEMEMICFQLIANSGAAKSAYLEALELAKTGQEEAAQAKLDEAEECFVLAHQVHSELIQKEASGQQTPVSLLLMHAEDQMASVEVVQLLVRELMAVHQAK